MKLTRQYLIELGSALGLYFALLFGAIAVDDHLHPEGPVRLALAATPMLGGIGMLVAIMRHIRQLDELQRKIQFEGLAFGFACTAMITVTWGFLEGAGAPRFPTFGIWPLMALTWVVGGLIAKRRYQ